MKFLKKMIRNEEAATAIEYGLIAARIAVAGITAFTAVGTSVRGTFQNAASKMSVGTGGAATTTTGN